MDEKQPSAAHLTRRQIAFAAAWAEADPDEPLYEVAKRAGYSESVSASGKVAELCRHPEIVKLRDRRLVELKAASGVTPEDALINLQAIASNKELPAKDRVAASKAILAWYAKDKGQHTELGAGPKAAKGITAELRSELEVDVLGVPLDDEAPP